MSDISTMNALPDRLRGNAVSRGDAEYDEARSLYNGMIDRRPEMIVRCATPDDVAAAVGHARENGILLAIRGGGHNGAGLGSCDGGLVIDLAPMNDVSVDAEAGIVRAGGGCTQGEVDRATSPHGLAVPAGIVSSTGIGGLTLGGGHGYLTRQHGLTVDNLLAAEVVLADGSRVTASAEENPDLFWALRGGGGNFGVVTEFTFRAHPVSDVYAGPIFYDIGDTAEAMRAYRDLIGDAPRRLAVFFGIKCVPSVAPFPEELWGRHVCALIGCFNGTEAEGVAAMKPFREAMPAPLMDGMSQMAFVDVQAMFDPLIPKGLQWYWKGDFVDDLSDAAIAVHVEHGSRSPTEKSLMHLYPIDGAARDVARAETPWGARGSSWSMVIAAIDPDPAKAGELKAWAKDYWAALHEHSRHGGAYVNFMADDEGEARVRAAYGSNYGRLREIKRRYDPKNLFRVNQNIAP
jgi:FAD/FMN-containing dehydrogenase